MLGKTVRPLEEEEEEEEEADKVVVEIFSLQIVFQFKM